MYIIIIIIKTTSLVFHVLGMYMFLNISTIKNTLSTINNEADSSHPPIYLFFY